MGDFLEILALDEDVCAWEREVGLFVLGHQGASDTDLKYAVWGDKDDVSMFATLVITNVSSRKMLC